MPIDMREIPDPPVELLAAGVAQILVCAGGLGLLAHFGDVQSRVAVAAGVWIVASGVATLVYLGAARWVSEPAPAVGGDGP